ncbi:hypothetical protein SLEP1_g40344 [Rubroshorea leprosula]|uniref:Uncharacterized protein n=1 Tax=Rubroshorea leprosula TaxID=152421 RepID=A0AAV5L398_9ROSI|nr:hypothetical protein SLEP1_g40344 [Rubroshorea leprosula]
MRKGSRIFILQSPALHPSLAPALDRAFCSQISPLRPDFVQSCPVCRSHHTPLHPSAAPSPALAAQPCFLHQPCSTPNSIAPAFCTLHPYKKKQPIPDKIGIID